MCLKPSWAGRSRRLPALQDDFGLDAPPVRERGPESAAAAAPGAGPAVPGMLCAPGGVTNALPSSDNPVAIGLPALSASIPRLGQHCPGVRHGSSRCSGGPAIKWRRGSHSRDPQWGGIAAPPPAPGRSGGAAGTRRWRGQAVTGNQRYRARCERTPVGDGAPWAGMVPPLLELSERGAAGPFVRPAGPGAPQPRSRTNALPPRTRGAR